MGRDRKNEHSGDHFTKMVRSTMETAAWRSLTPFAQALYPWLKLEWRGPKANNNGHIRFSVRQGAEALGANRKTVAKAFHQLQATGFIVMTEPARLGSGGVAMSPAWEITEIGMPNHEQSRPRHLFRNWAPGRDYPVHRAAAQNPRGLNGAAKGFQHPSAHVFPMKVVN